MAQSKMSQENPEVWKQLVDRLYLRRDLDCSHITIAIDQGMFVPGTGGRSWWDKVWSRLLFHRACADYRHKFHLTCSQDDLPSLIGAFERSETDRALRELESEFLSLVSISLSLVSISMTAGSVVEHLNPVKEVWLPSGTKLGVNLTVSEEGYVEEYAHQIVDLARMDTVDQVYLIHKKVSDPEAQQRIWERYEQVTQLIISARMGLSDALETAPTPSNMFSIKKIVLDQCLRQMVGRRTCGGGIERIAIWPNGKVTACPFDSKGNFCMDSIYETNHFRNYPVDFCKHCVMRAAAQAQDKRTIGNNHMRRCMLFFH